MKKFSFAFFNARSLCNKFDEFKTFILRENYDVVGVGETWFNQNTLDHIIHIPGYNLVRNDRVFRGGGTAIYIRANILHTVLHLNYRDSVEQLWVSFKVDNRKFAFGNLYRPPDKSVSSFLIDFEEIFADIYTQFDEIICGGDVNIDFLDSTCNNVLKFNNCIDLFNMQQVINEPTRITATTESLIDIILISNQYTSFSHGNKEIYISSDHQLVYCILDFEIDEGDEIIYSRNLKGVDRNMLQNFLYVTPFEEIFHMQDINDKVSYFNHLLTGLFDTIAPLRETRLKKPRPPWFTDNIKLLLKLRDNALSKYKKTKNLTHYEYYKQLKNFTTVAIRNEKKGYLKYCVDTFGRNSRIMWQKLKNLNINSKPAKSKLPENLNVPNDINNHFLLATGNCADADQDLLLFYTNNFKDNFRNLLSFTTVNQNTIYKYLNEIKTQAIGIDGLQINMLLMCCPYILIFITNIVNSCIKESFFPGLWKVTKVFPLPKKNNISSFSELRPISILSVLSKVLEKVIKYQIESHINNYNILPISQSGFRRGYSCTSALLEVTDDIFRDIDKGYTNVLILLDYTKAFDTINHQLLFSILHYVGFSVKATEFIKNYLSDRSQFVETSAGRSDIKNIACGVPQGSILGPILFCIYSTNISSALTNGRVYIYADDTQIRFSLSDFNVALTNELINSELIKIVNFSNRHQLTINPAKTQILVFGKNKKELAEHLSVSIDGVLVACVDVAKNLGLHLDTDLKFKSHVNNCIKRAYANLKMLYPHRHVLDQNIKILLCDTMVLSHFNYCDVVYGPCIDYVDINRIQRVQNSCLRYIYGIKKYERISHKLIETNWLNMETRRNLHMVTLYHKIISLKSPPYLYNKITFRSDVHNVHTRFRGHISPPLHRTSKFQGSFSYMIFKLYNLVPPKLKHLSTNMFKQKYKHLLMSENI